MIKFFYNDAGDVCGFSEDDLKFLGEKINAYKALTKNQIEEHLNPKPSIEQLEIDARIKRDVLLSETDWVVTRHRDEVEAGSKTTLSDEAYSAMQAYRRDLRDITEQPGFPEVIDWPQKPE